MSTFKKATSFVFYGICILLLLFLLAMEAIPRIRVPLPTKLIIGIISLLFLIAATAFRVCSTEHDGRKTKAVRVTLWLIFAVYAAYLCYLLLLDASYGRAASAWWKSDVSYSLRLSAYSKEKLNLIPFQTIISFFQSVFKDYSGVDRFAARQELTYAATNLAGNLLAFAPMGLLIPALFKRLRRFGAFILTVMLALTAVEILQLLLMVGSCDIDDILLNATGAAVVFWMTKWRPVKNLLAKTRIMPYPEKR